MEARKPLDECYLIREKRQAYTSHAISQSIFLSHPRDIQASWIEVEHTPSSYQDHALPSIDP
jgi:hypothetical protein